jgi:hypothetical protein
MSRIATGWRLAKHSWTVLRADSSLALFPVLATAFAALAVALTLTPGLIAAEAADRDWIVVPFMLVGGYAATFFVVYFNVALAGATRLSMDGRDTSVADGLAVARQRRGLIAKWAFLQFAVGVIIGVARHLAGDSLGGRLVALVSGIAGVAWSVATFFVIPLLALEGLGPRDAFKRSASLVRERWGEGLVGSAAIGLAVFLVAALPLYGLFHLSFAVIDANPAVGAPIGVVAILALAATAAFGSALGVIFRVQLYRYSTEGAVAGGFDAEDIEAAFRPSRRALGEANPA